jgi:hypothetical protein
VPGSWYARECSQISALGGGGAAISMALRLELQPHNMVQHVARAHAMFQRELMAIPIGPML